MRITRCESSAPSSLVRQQCRIPAVIDVRFALRRRITCRVRASRERRSSNPPRFRPAAPTTRIAASTARCAAFAANACARAMASSALLATIEHLRRAVGEHARRRHFRGAVGERPVRSSFVGSRLHAGLLHRVERVLNRRASDAKRDGSSQQPRANAAALRNRRQRGFAAFEARQHRRRGVGFPADALKPKPRTASRIACRQFLDHQRPASMAWAGSVLTGARGRYEGLLFGVRSKVMTDKPARIGR